VWIHWWTKTTLPNHNPDMILEVDTGVLNSSCGNSGVCVEDASSSTGGRCIVTLQGPLFEGHSRDPF
jgi:hypothetical protein